MGLTFLLFLYYPLIKAFYNYYFGYLETPRQSSGEKKEVFQSQINYDDFYIIVPGIKAKSKIIANTSATNKNAYMEALKKGVAHARGTAFPGEGRLIYLFAHSTDAPYNIIRYNAVFFLLNKLEKGDDIFIRFSGHLYRYKVVEKKVVGAFDIKTVYSLDDNKEVLVLQTCWPPGTTWNRLLVIAEP